MPKRSAYVPVFLAVCLAVFLANTGVAVPADDGEIARLVKGLGSTDWQERDRSEERLGELGLPAKRALDEATRSRDEEVAWRARKILARITRTRLTVALSTPEGTPGAGLPLSVNLLRMPGTSTASEGRTDADGRLALDTPLEAGSYQLQASSPGYLPIRIEPLCLAGGERTAAIRLERGAKVSGTLSFQDGKGAAGIALGLMPCLEPAQIHRYLEIGNRRETVSDAEGRFAFEPVPEGNYRLMAEARVRGGLAQIFPRRLLVLHEGEILAGLALALPDDPATVPGLMRDAILSGRCVDAAGKPLSGHLRFFLDGVAGWPEHSGEAKAGADGSFAALVPPGRHWLSANLPHTAPTTMGPVSLAPGANPPLTLVLGPGGSLSGVAVGPQGVPVEGAEIAHYHPGRLEVGTPETSITHQILFADKQGRFAVPNAAPGTWEMRATVEGGGLGPAQTLQIKEGETRQLTLPVPEGVVVTGRVLAEDGTPCEHAQLRAYAEAWDAHAGDPWEPYAGAQGESFSGGEFEMVLPVPGAWRIVAEKAGFRRGAVAAVSRKPGDRVGELTVRLAPAAPGSLLVRVVDAAGRPLPCAQVQVLSLHPCRGPLRTDARGEALLDQLPPGAYPVAVTKVDFAPLIVWADVSEDAQASVTCVLKEGSGLSGRLLDAAGRPLPGHAVWAWRDEFSIRHVEEQFGTAAWETLTDDEGRYRFEHLPPGKLKVTPAPDGRAAPLWIGAVPPDGRSLDGVNFTLTEGLSLEVAVTDPKGKPVPNASVEAYPAGSLTDPYSIDLYAVAFTDAQGVARLPGLPPGAIVDLLVNHPDHPWVFRRAQKVPAEGIWKLEVPIGKGERCEGRIRFTPPARLGDAFQEDVFVLALGPGAGKTRVREDGRFVFVRLLPGEYEVFLTVGNRRMAGVPLTVEAGKDASCGMTLARPLPALDY
jgi:protocatechuate 3,4-dioxygenase beta subunit